MEAACPGCQAHESGYLQDTIRGQQHRHRTHAHNLQLRCENSKLKCLVDFLHPCASEFEAVADHTTLEFHSVMNSDPYFGPELDNVRVWVVLAKN